MTFAQLYRIITLRKMNNDTGSYVASLFCEGTDRIIQKVGEESVEVVIAAKNDNRTRQIEELSDLFFHILILMVSLGITLPDVFQELSKRNSKRSKNA